MINEFLNDTVVKLENLIGLEEEELEKRDMYVKEVIDSIKNQKRKLDEDDFEMITEKEGEGSSRYHPAEDFLFVETISKPGKNKNWKPIYNQGKTQGFFQSCISSDNLKNSNI